MRFWGVCMCVWDVCANVGVSVVCVYVSVSGVSV